MEEKNLPTPKGITKFDMLSLLSGAYLLDI